VRVIANPASPDIEWMGSKPELSSSSAPYKIYNIGNSNTVNLMDFIRGVELASGHEIKKEFLPLQPGDVVATYADVSALEKDTKYRPNTSIEKGIEKTVVW